MDEDLNRKILSIYDAAYAPEKFEYPINRFAMEVKRQLDVLDKNLAEREFLIGEDYTIADMATWPWYGVLVTGDLYSAQEFLDVQSYTHVKRWAQTIEARVPVQRGRRVNRAWGPEDEQVPVRNLQTILEAIDRAGYKAGEDILLPARVVAVANAFVAMINPRAWRPGMSVDDAIERLLAEVGGAFDRRVVAALINRIDNRDGRGDWEGMRSSAA